MLESKYGKKYRRLNAEIVRQGYIADFQKERQKDLIAKIEEESVRIKRRTVRFKSMNFLNSLFLGTPATLFVFGAYALAKQYLDPRLPEIDDSTLLEMWKISFALSTLNMGLLKAIEVYNNLRLTRTMNHCGHSGKWKLNQVLYKKDNFSGDLSSATTSYWFDYVMQRDR